MSYNLFAIFKVIGGNYKRVISFMSIAIVMGLGAYWVIPKKYEADTVFILKNPVFADRNNIYNYEAKFLSYVADDDVVDQLISMASSDSLQNTVISTMHLAAAYHFDSTDLEQRYKLRKYFQRHLKIYRNDYKNIVLTYTDKEPARAAAVANLCVNLLETSLRGFYNGMRKDMYNSIMNKIHEEDSTIALLTDSLTKIRETYGIYDIISPSRYNLMLSAVKGNGHSGFANGIEQVQNVESLKDELVGDRAKHVSLANQYSTGTEINEMPLTQIIQVAKPPFRHIALDMAITGGGSAILGFLFAVVYILMNEYFHRMKSMSE